MTWWLYFLKTPYQLETHTEYLWMKWHDVLDLAENNSNEYMVTMAVIDLINVEAEFSLESSEYIARVYNFWQSMAF